MQGERCNALVNGFKINLFLFITWVLGIRNL